MRFLDHRNCSPNTSRAYAFDLIRFFKFLKGIDKSWVDVCLDDFVDFTYYLQHATKTDNVSLLPAANQIARSSRTINRHVSTVCGFYTYHQIHQGLKTPQLEPLLLMQGSKQRNSFLSYGKRSAPSSLNKAKLPIGRRATVKTVCKTVEVKYRKAIIDACCNKMETGMRIGQALQLRHEDIESWNSRIKMQYRRDNANGVYAKTKQQYYIHVSPEWLNAYLSMLINSDIDSD